MTVTSQENNRQSGTSIRTSMTFSEPSSPPKQSREQIMGKAQGSDDMKDSMSATENVQSSSLFQTASQT